MIYDKAHEMAKALKGSNEYNALLAAKKALDADTDAKKMVCDFMAKRLELEYDAMAGKAEDKGKTEQLQQMYSLIAHNTKARDFLESYTRFQVIMADISKIIGEAVAEGLDIFAKD